MYRYVLYSQKNSVQKNPGKIPVKSRAVRYIFVCVHLKACTGVHHWFFGLFLIGFLNGLVHRGLLQPGHVEGISPVFIFGIHEWPHLKQR
jgi:hypothetical protein